ncbi:phBC6A51 family helix-turn-helix protein [Lysinibacillus xylanilyticus]|uniref:PhBC6A51 family helix-turn-helix protein n=1 Tax=Lysinibacillus xylanilyticus TaxID=582475 RepID=A0ABT4EUR2_9BACI|nr:phBC6A51 family helix-turn-helix protein [Lysinibacillus xylanilyticus]MCY9549412.1 phBC6A51 family helix-turn-helix protein [Lysinibacillus xylanilyticus]
MASKLEEIMRELNLEQVKAAQLLFENDTIPPKQRRTFEQIADELGIEVRTLYNWRKLAAMLDYKVAMTDTYTKEHRARIMSAVIRESELGNASMTKLFMQNQGMLIDRVEYEDKSEKVDESAVAAKLASIKARY